VIRRIIRERAGMCRSGKIRRSRFHSDLGF
jgi:hypothetical protein